MNETNDLVVIAFLQFLNKSVYLLRHRICINGWSTIRIFISQVNWVKW